MTSRCMHDIFFRGRELKHSKESVLPVMKKEGNGKGKWTIGPRMKHGSANVVYFDQRLGAAHSKRWLKSSFSAKKAEKMRKKIYTECYTFNYKDHLDPG